MRFEKFKNILIPIERVMWVEFDAKGDWLDEGPHTLVWIAIPGGMTRAIKFKGNQVEKLQEWLKQFPEAGSCVNVIEYPYGNFIDIQNGRIANNDPNKLIKQEDIIFKKYGKDDQKIDKPYPAYTYTTSDGKTIEIPLDGESTDASL